MNRRSLLLGSLVAGAAGLFGVKAKVAPVDEVITKKVGWKDDITWATISVTNTDVMFGGWPYEAIDLHSFANKLPVCYDWFDNL